MAELLADPGFDLIYGRTGSVFIVRESGPDAVAAIGRMSDAGGPTEAAVVFPEGQLFRPERLAKSRARIAERDPARAQRLAELRHVLPPRPAGTLALLEALPTADVVVMAHTGLERFAAFSTLARAVPLRSPVRVAAWRIPASEIPRDREAQVEWLDAQWLRLDGWCDSRR